MSYNQKFRRTVSVPYRGSVTVSYPASKTGGTTTAYYSGTAHEEVEVDIHVNTVPFDASVADCNNTVGGLTASVGAMNAAQCLAIAQNAEKVSKTIINGFFHTIRTDLSTQKAELEQAIQAKLMLLRQQAESLRKKQENMAEDYARTTARYQKTFEDLNKELSNRIHEIDQPIFKLVSEVDSQSDRMLHTDMVQTAVTMYKESSTLQAQISTATVKRHALEAMNQAQNFLMSKALTERTIQKTTIEGNGQDKYFVPVCYMKTESENKHVEQQCVMPDYYMEKNPRLKENLCNKLEEMELGTDDENSAEQLRSYVQTEIGNNIKGNDIHSTRVRDMINKMLNK
jgi:hypothetical protein